jgi:cytidylate kinase
MSDGFIVALDGTAASGKSTTARKAAKKLGFLYLDTGAMYRAITLKVIRKKLNPKEGPGLRKLLDETKVDLKLDQTHIRVFLDGEDVTEAIRSPEVDRWVSPVSALPMVRERMVAIQRALADGKRIICEGRDTGSVVFPEAQLKIFIDAKVDERARRRQKELHERGVELGISEVIGNLKERDSYDSQRQHSPLKMVADAVLLDTTDLSVDEEVSQVVSMIQARLAE